MKSCELRVTSDEFKNKNLSLFIFSRKKINHFFLLLLILTLNSQLSTRNSNAAFLAEDAGAVAGQFLKLGVSARADALSGAYGALGNDWSAMSYNPALLAQVSRANIGIMYADQDNDVVYGHMAWAAPVWKLGQFGVNFTYLTYGNLTGYDDSGFGTGDFSPKDMAIGLGWAKAFAIGRGYLAPGISLKTVQMTITETAQTMAYDTGLFFKYGRLGLGLSVANMGSQVGFISGEEALPEIQRASMALRVLGPWRVSADYIRAADSDPAIAVGSELGIPLGDGPRLNLRFGVNTLALAGSLEGMSGYSAGFGFQDEILDVDYAFVPMGNLGTTHRISIGVRFGDPHFLP